MNEEQKAFINELLKKDGNLEHGKKSKVSKSKDNPYHEDVKTNYKYNGEPAVFNKLFDYVKSDNSIKKTQTQIANILAEILKNKNYSYFEQWDKFTFSKNGKKSEYGKKLYEVVLKLIEENEPNKYYDTKNNKILDKSLTIDDLETTKNDDNSEELDEDKSLKNDEKSTTIDEDKSFKPDEEILIENEEKSIKPNDQISPNELSINETSSTNAENYNNKSIDKSIDKSENVENLLNSAPIIKTKVDDNKDLIPKSPIVNKSVFSLNDKEKQLFKNIELALSYKDNKEYQDNNELEFKRKNGKTYKEEKPSKKLKTLVHQQIAKYMKYFKDKKSDGSLNETNFIKLKQEIIDKINDRYFKENNKYGFHVYNKNENTGSFEIKNLGDSKNERRVKKNYVNQNAPNKFSFFIYNMKDIYSIIEEYFEINLSIHSKTLIESIIRTSVDKYVRIADKTGQISYHTIPHGIETDTVIKLIEKYINSKRNIHIKSKFEFDSDSRSKLMEIINKEINRNKNDFKQKSKNIISFINHLKFI